MNHSLRPALNHLDERIAPTVFRVRVLEPDRQLHGDRCRDKPGAIDESHRVPLSRQTDAHRLAGGIS